MSSDPSILRAILAPLSEGSVLLPNNVVAEVIEYAKPLPYEHGPPWLLGELEWNGWQVPIISFVLLSGSARRDPAGSDSRILIVKTLTEEVSMYYLGILIKGLPKLKRLAPDSIVPLDGEHGSPVVFCRVDIDEQQAVIPALEALTHSVAAAVYDQ